MFNYKVKLAHLFQKLHKVAAHHSSTDTNKYYNKRSKFINYIFCTALSMDKAFANFVLFYLFKSTHAKIEREHSGGSEQEEEGDN